MSEFDETADDLRSARTVCHPAGEFTENVEQAR
jgi:hypothetical protein